MDGEAQTGLRHVGENQWSEEQAHRWERKGAESRSLRSSPPSRGQAGQGAGEADGGRAARLCPGSRVLRQTSSRSVSLY